jgi:predicted esterase
MALPAWPIAPFQPDIDTFQPIQRMLDPIAPNRGLMRERTSASQPALTTSPSSSPHSMLDPVHLVGWSHGGLVAITAAVSHPSLVRSLILYEATVIPVLPQRALRAR